MFQRLDIWLFGGIHCTVTALNPSSAHAPFSLKGEKTKTIYFSSLHWVSEWYWKDIFLVEYNFTYWHMSSCGIHSFKTSIIDIFIITMYQEIRLMCEGSLVVMNRQLSPKSAAHSYIASSIWLFSCETCNFINWVDFHCFHNIVFGCSSQQQKTHFTLLAHLQTADTTCWWT